MDNLTWLHLPNYLISIINFVGILTIAYYLSHSIKQITYRIKYKSWPRNPQDYKFFLLEEENKKLSQKVADLEKENLAIFNSIIDNIKR